MAICFARTFGSPLRRSGTSCLLPLASRRPLGCRSTRVGDTTTRWTGWRRGTSSYGTTQRWTHPTRWRRGRQDSRKVGLGFTHHKGLLEKSWFLLAGDIPGAVLLFESACQKHPDSAEAWTLLGKTQAKNEQDPLAIAALRQALTLLGPSAKESSSVLMALAASYANESYQALACNTLQGSKNFSFKAVGSRSRCLTVCRLDLQPLGVHVAAPRQAGPQPKPEVSTHHHFHVAGVAPRDDRSFSHGTCSMEVYKFLSSGNNTFAYRLRG